VFIQHHDWVTSAIMSISRRLVFGGILLISGGGVLAEESASAASPVGAHSRAAAPQQKEATFNVWEYRVTGNSLIDRTLVERTVYGFLGPHRTIKDVEAARVALETLYKNSGFPTVVVDLPEQNVSNGIVTLQVVQGTIDRTRISGSRYFSLGEIRNSIPALAEDQVPYLPDVQAQLQSLNQASPDRQVTPIFRPGRTPGTVEVELRVKDELPVHGSVEVNGRNSADTSRTRLVGTLRYDNLWQRLHSMSLMYQVSPENLNEVKVFAGTYVLPVGRSDDRLALYAIRSESDSQVATAGALAVIGKGTILGARWVMPLPASQNYYHSLTLGGDWKDFNEGTQLVGADTLDTPIDYSSFATEYSGSLLGNSTLTSFSLGAHVAPRGLGNSESEFDNKRLGARPNFAYATADLSEDYKMGHGLRLRGAMQGQLSGQPLISNEQFSAGGAESVRGYHEAEVLGDDGLQASLELHGPTIATLAKQGFSDFHPLVFADGALVKVRDPLPGTESQQEIYGAGFGMRIAWQKAFEGMLDFAWPFASTDSTDKGDLRVHFLLRSGF